MTVLGGVVDVLGASVAVSGAWAPVVEPVLESELDVSGELEELGDSEPEGVVDDEEAPLQPARAKIRPAATTTALLPSFTSSPTTE